MCSCFTAFYICNMNIQLYVVYIEGPETLRFFLKYAKGSRVKFTL